MADALTLYHNPKCSTSRKALDGLQGTSVPVTVVEYLKEPLDEDGLRALLDILEDPPADLVRKDSYFKELGLDPAEYTEVDPVVALLARHPRLMQRPVGVRGGRAVIGRPPERVIALAG